MSARLLSALPLLCATLMLATGGAPFFWPLGLAVLALSSVLVPLARLAHHLRCAPLDDCGCVPADSLGQDHHGGPGRRAPRHAASAGRRVLSPVLRERALRPQLRSRARGLRVHRRGHRREEPRVSVSGRGPRGDVARGERRRSPRSARLCACASRGLERHRALGGAGDLRRRSRSRRWIAPRIAASRRSSREECAARASRPTCGSTKRGSSARTRTSCSACTVPRPTTCAAPSSIPSTGATGARPSAGAGSCTAPPHPREHAPTSTRRSRAAGCLPRVGPRS